MKSRILFGISLLTLGCNVPDPAGPSRGTDTQGGACGRGLVVVSSDYHSSNVSLLGVNGDVLSESFISSASESPALSAPLSGDVVVPTMPATSDRILLIDRYPASVLTWVDVASAAVVSQLSVATGFASNPHDYVEITPQKAYVTRFEPNFAAGAEPFDQGNDILIVDPTAPKILGRIDMLPAMQGEDPKFFPRASRAVRVGERVYVLLQGYSADFKESAPSRVVAVDVDTDAIVDVLTLDGKHGCDGLAVSPTQEDLAVSCSGEFGGDAAATIAESGVVIIRAEQPLKERVRFDAKQFGEGPVGFSITYATASHVFFNTFGRLATEKDPGADDTFIELDLESGGFNVLLRSSGEPFTLGEARCLSGCEVCFGADAKKSGGVVHRFDLSDAGQVASQSVIKVEMTIGLPPRSIGGF